MKRVLVAGATGALGRMVVAELGRRGFGVRALCGSRQRAEGLPAFVDIAIADALQPETLTNLTNGIDVVFSCAGQTVRPDLSVRGPGYLDVDLPANLNLIEMAKQGKVSRFVYVSVLRAAHFPRVAYLAAHARVAAALKQSPLEYGIVEPTTVFSQLQLLVEVARAHGGIQFGDGEARSNPIDDGDLANLCADLIDGVGSMVVQAGGPETFTQKQMMEAAFEARDTPSRIRRIPLWMLRAACTLGFRLVAPRLSEWAEFMQVLSTRDFIAPALGERKLRDHFRALK